MRPTAGIYGGMYMKAKKIISLLLALALAASLFAGCGGDGKDSSSQEIGRAHV